MRVLNVFLFLMFAALFPLFGKGDSLNLNWDKTANRQWVGADFWANRLQDWGVKDHKVFCFRPGENSTMHLLSTEIVKDAPFSGTIRLGKNAVAANDAVGKSGLILGLSDTALNYLARSTMQHFFLKENGVWIGINSKNQLFIEEIFSGAKVLSAPLDKHLLAMYRTEGLLLNFNVVQGNGAMELAVFAQGDDLKQHAVSMKIPMGVLNGNITFAVNSKLYLSEYFFDDFKISGEAISVKKEREFGPISTCLYSFNDRVLNFSAQLMPLGLNSRDSVLLELFMQNEWLPLVTMPVDTIYGQARLRNYSNWSFGTVPYRARLKRNFVFEGEYYKGIISFPNSTENQLKIGVLSCNGMPFIERQGMDYWQIWKAYELTAKKYAIEKPELVVFLGDQMYESRPVPMDWDKKNYAMDYQYRWLMWCLQFNDITKKIPSLIIMDDHDYFQGNLWGANGDTISKNSMWKMPADFAGDETDWLMENGGFMQDTAFIKYAVTLQTGHLPSTYGESRKAVPDYYSVLKFKGVGMALLEDRKYKSPPLKALPNVKSFNGFPMSDAISSDSLYNENAQLLDSGQLKMLDNWSTDWDSEEMKIVFTQSVYSSLSSVKKGYQPISGKSISINDSAEVPTRLSKDMDSNGWPKSGRDKALKNIRKSGALLVGGDQHFPSVVQQGIENWKDASYSFTLPAISNTYPRFWMPNSSDHFSGNNFEDGFGNKVSMVAYSNPTKNDSLPLWMNHAPGIGFITCDKVLQTYKLDCWGFADTLQQYSGWPVTVKVSDNVYASSEFTTQAIKVKAIKLPLISVVDLENGKLLYSIRLNKQRLKVPHAGNYKLIVHLNDMIVKEVVVNTGKGSVKVK